MIPSTITASLLRWFELNKRALPWRTDRDPYHVWVSEIMLQQTRIEAVMSYYARFMAALPDVRSLSKIDDDALLKLWQGLGYYSRARNLKKAAQTVMKEYGGSFPQTYSELRRLAGIGDYTAGAIASICFDEKVPAVDGNVLRVAARLTANRDNVLLPETKRRVAKELTAIMPDKAGDFNEALMELGETVCLPNGTPDCERCPLKAQCRAHELHLTEELPIRIKTAKRRSEQKTVLLLTAEDGSIALEKRPDSGLLGGMYQLPNFEGYYSDEELKALLLTHGVTVADIEHLPDSKHIFTHIEWRMQCRRVTVGEKAQGYIWATKEALQTTYALPTAFAKILGK